MQAVSAALMAYSVPALKRVESRYAAVIMMTIFRIFLLISVLTFMLAACGQRGPLYLPDESASVAVPVQVSQPPAVPPAAPPAMPTRVPPDPLDSGFEEETNQEDNPSEDEQANGL